VTTLSYSSLQEYERCGFRFYAERVLGLPAPERRGSERGLLLHALLERLDFRRPVLPGADAVAAAAARIGVAAPGSAEAGELVATVGRFAAGELCARLGRAADVRREARFAFGLAGGALLVGALDVLAREPGGGALIVDYKSDRLGAEPVSADGYAIQRLVYAVAGLRSGAAGVEVVHCFLLRPDEPATVAFSSQDRPALEERLRALAAGPLERRFSETAAPHSRVCSGCPAEGGLCRWPLSMTRRESPDTLF
jgi:RecB family exonuclease